MEKSPLGTACVFTIFLESFVGLLTNFVIIVVISSRYLKRQDVSGNDKIILALSVSNVGYVCVAFPFILLYNFWPSFFGTIHSIVAVFVSLLFFVTSSSWLTASLCFYYYVKIKQFSSKFLSSLKIKIGSLVPWMILMSVLLSLFGSALDVLQISVKKGHSQNLTAVQSTNALGPYTSHIFQGNLYVSYISTLIPFLISVVTTASTVWSLNLHRLKMKRKRTSSSSKERVDTYKDIVEIMIYLLIFYAAFYPVLFLIYFNTFVEDSVSFWISLIIICSYSPVQSILLSLAATKLKNAWKKIFHCSAEYGEGDECGKE